MVRNNTVFLFKDLLKNKFVILLLSILSFNLIFNCRIMYFEQIFGFIFLMIIPGFLLMNLFEIDKLDIYEKLVLSVGISLSFLMISCILLNEISINLLYLNSPLSRNILLIYLCILYICLILMLYIRKANPLAGISIKLLSLSQITPSEKLFLSIPMLFPALSLFGSYLMNERNNNLLIFSLFIIIPIYLIIICVFNETFPTRLYPIIILLLSLSLLILMGLRSYHIMGDDSHEEYYLFFITLESSRWVASNDILSACLSVTILPTIFASLLEISPESLFKVLFALIYSIAPLIIYIISKKFLTEFYAFLASCFFMFQHVFLNTVTTGRSSIAILFLCLFVMVMNLDNISLAFKKFLLIIFAISCIFSHYSTSYIFLIMLFCLYLSSRISYRKTNNNRLIDFTLLILFISVIFVWYSQASAKPFNSGIYFALNTINELTKAFVEESRSPPVYELLGKNIGYKALPSVIEFVFTWLTFLLIGLGFLASIIGLKKKSSNFFNKRDGSMFLMLSFYSLCLLVAMIILPFVSNAYSIQKTYNLTLITLSTFFIIGGVIIANYLKIKPYIIILLVLIPYFLSVSTISYQIYGIHNSILLNSDGPMYDKLFVHDSDSYSAKWLGKTISSDKIVYGDLWGYRFLKSQGLIANAFFYSQLISDGKLIPGAYLYLRYTNIIQQELIGTYNSTKLSKIKNINLKSKIYSNKFSEIFF